jgi:phosphatidylinositol glycan class B
MPRAPNTKAEGFTGLGLFLSLWVLRVFNAVVVQTYFDPDEHWQSLEVAHGYVFGYGGRTWEWNVGLRSSLYLLPFIAYFWVVKLVSLDKVDLLIVMVN